MEGHTSNLYNEIADQLQCPARALTQEETAARASRIHRKSTKNRPKSVQNRSKIGLGSALGASCGHLPPKTAPRPQKTSKTAFADPSPDPRWVQNPCKIDPEAIQMQYFFAFFFGSRSNTSGDRFSSDPGSEKGAKIDPKSMSRAILQKMQNP